MFVSEIFNTEKNVQLEQDLQEKTEEAAINDRLSAVENMLYSNNGLIGVDKFKK